MPVMDTSDRAFPGPCTFFSSACACALARAVSAETDASNSEAAADSEEAAAEAEARAEPMIDEAAEARADGGVPLNDEVSGGVARGVTEAAPLSPPLFVLHETSAAPQVRVARRATVARLRPVRAGPPWVRLLMELVLFLPVRKPGLRASLMLRAGLRVRDRC
jgi:hypothetical protein